MVQIRWCIKENKNENDKSHPSVYFNYQIGMIYDKIVCFPVCTVVKEVHLLFKVGFQGI